jgi:uncharacterized protein GlcG (DUF336 family)/mannose-6-phosphate isomerase-like protein (cupin superfamily)
MPPGGTIAVVDAGGHVVALERLDDTFPASASVAVEKARTSAVFRKPTRDFENAVKSGRTSLVAVDVMLPLQGGVPIVRGGQVIGAIGVSGAASAQQDDDIAAAAAAAFATDLPVQSTRSESVAFLGAKQVSDAFSKGAPLLENGAYKIHASRRDAPGMAEVHDRDTDIVYVLEGSATFVTGGTMVNGRITAQDEVRGTGIDGGTTRQLAKGDVVVVPNGTPHWFKDVKVPLLYYVVKITSADVAGGTR